MRPSLCSLYDFQLLLIIVDVLFFYHSLRLDLEAHAGQHASIPCRLCKGRLSAISDRYRDCDKIYSEINVLSPTSPVFPTSYLNRLSVCAYMVVIVICDRPHSNPILITICHSQFPLGDQIPKLYVHALRSSAKCALRQSRECIMAIRA